MCDVILTVDEIQRRFDRRAQDRESIGFCYFDRHVQMQNGEVFILNASLKEFEAMDLKTKRNGGVAFTFRGVQYPETRHLYSVFAQRSELEELGINCQLLDTVKTQQEVSNDAGT